MRLDVFSFLKRTVGLFAAVLLLLVLTNSASAQCGERRKPVRNFIANVAENRPVRTAIFGGRVQAQPCSPAAAGAVPQVMPGPGAMYYSLPNCTNGNCAVPAGRFR